ncbi:hypothetical protein [Ectothiorhodospira variabilis]|uniref:hypothetical protein n=1 Tax=Ectothiorhodospira variabilis TaxID=505694 RepID=UPI001EFB797B|nr:hypothetical protein [Ectothiorhodospira variabilis]MCG5495460.1 hypothetical protein [Ectothiorhodospira variabilis]MCG5505058.1 hypothetical protein [Ectothiorhodospira variabilis]MCG5508215.1 hypothetical protein [Ectothiorhodospira variabilis]
MNLIIFLFLLGVATSSIYILPSGNPQPSDFLLFLTGLVVIFFHWNRLSGIHLLWPMLVLTIWVGIVSAAWSIAYPFGSFDRYPLFYLFNFVFMLAFVNIYISLKTPDVVFSRVIEMALIVSGVGVIISIVAPSLLLASESVRITGFFNNPNQLAYYSLCMMGALIVLNDGALGRRLSTLLSISSGVIGVFAAASLGAMAGLVFLLLAIMLANWSSLSRVFNAMFGVLFVLTLFFGFDLYTEGAISDRFDARMARLEVKVESIESERKYDRILAYPEYWMFGAGEGSTERFQGYERGEIHSTFGNILFSYGVIGLLLLCVLLFKSLRQAPWYVWLVMAAPLTYSMTHMGLRFTAFWFLVALILVKYRKPRIRAGEAGGFANNILSSLVGR